MLNANIQSRHGSLAIETQWPDREVHHAEIAPAWPGTWERLFRWTRRLYTVCPYGGMRSKRVLKIL
jgi:hypothetical protein